jgi:hypothetical protein
MGHEAQMAELDPAAETMLSPGDLVGAGWDPPLSRTEVALRSILVLSFGAVLALEAYLIWQVVRLDG